MKRRYPIGLFLFGFITDIIFHYFYLFVLAIILFIIGIFVKTSLYIGLVILAIDILLSLIERIRIRAAIMTDSENATFRKFQDALSMDGDWRENTKNVFEEIINEKND